MNPRKYFQTNSREWGQIIFSYNEVDILRKGTEVVEIIIHLFHGSPWYMRKWWCERGEGQVMTNQTRSLSRHHRQEELDLPGVVAAPVGRGSWTGPRDPIQGLSSSSEELDNAEM